MKGETIACVVLALALSLTGCLERLSDSDEVEQDTASKAVKRYYDSMINEDANIFCYSFAKANGTRLTESEIEDCEDDSKIQMIENPYGERWMLEYDIESRGNTPFLEWVNYSSNLLEISNVTVSTLSCIRDSTDDPWECGDWFEMEVYVGRMSNGELLILENYEFVYGAYSSPIASFTSTTGSNGEYYVTVLSVSADYDLEAFSYSLKDGAGSTNANGEIAMQNLSTSNGAGNVVGIDASYGEKCGAADQPACDGDLSTRSDAVDGDSGSDYAVAFYDNDRDGMLSDGDKFTVRGSHGSGADGPAQDDWSLEVKFDNTGDVIGSKKLG